jgi:phasin family protein
MAKAPEDTGKPQAFPMDIGKAMGSFDPSKMMSEVSAMLQKYKVPGFDIDGLMAAQKKNMEAVTKANQTALQGIQALAKRQAEILQETMKETQAALSSLSTSGSPQEVAAKQAELAKASFEKAFGNMRELADIVSQSSREALDVINTRITASLEELRDMVLKSKS